MAEYRLSPAAQRDLEAIWRYTRKQWGIGQAMRYNDELLEGFAGFAKNPLHSPACDHIRPGYRRGCINQHVAYFSITEYGIGIIRILHVQMDASRHL